MSISKKYIGTKPEQAGPGVVWVEPSPLRGRLALEHHVYHSPDGFNWGYGGSGAVELARCLLWDFLGEEPEQPMYTCFAQTIVAQLPKEWLLTAEFLREWVERYLQVEKAVGHNAHSSRKGTP